MPQRFANKVALVAGGTGGLGRAVTLAFLEEGAKVIVTYRRQNEMDSLKQVAAGGGLLSGYAVDATHDSALAHLVQRITDEDGHLDVLVNAVGAYAGGAKFWEAEPAEFDRMLDVNLRAAAHAQTGQRSHCQCCLACRG
jgi:NAD(P)-dependent dehydrogenase (short-subunit alcohol dehydrogenase family)